MSLNKKYSSKDTLWKMVGIGKCPRLTCNGKIVKIGHLYECDTCTNFKISKKKFRRYS